MKKVLFLSVLITLSVFTEAQNAKFGIKGGLNMATITKDKEGNIDDNNINLLFNVGVFADLPLGTGIFSFQPGLYLNGKGAKYDLVRKDDNNYGTVKLSPYYTEAQANFLFNLPFSEGFKLYVGAGPYLAMGVFGKASIEGKALGIDISKDYDIEFSSNNASNNNDYSEYGKMKKWDYGVNITAGVELSNLVISANYGLGLAKIQAGVDDGNSTNANERDDFGKHRVFSISVGFLF